MEVLPYPVRPITSFKRINRCFGLILYIFLVSIIYFPDIFDIAEGHDMINILYSLSVTKHVLMLWVVFILIACAIIIPVRKYLNQEKAIP